jgi:hypothetical protein
MVDRYPGDGDKRPGILPTKVYRGPKKSEYAEDTWVEVDEYGNPREVSGGFNWRKADKSYGKSYGPFRKVNARKKAWNAESNRVSKHWPMDPPNYRKKKSMIGYPNSFFKTKDHKLLGEVVTDKESGGKAVVLNYYPKDKTFEVMDNEGFKSLVKRRDLDVPKVVKESKPRTYSPIKRVPLNSIPESGDSLMPFFKAQEGGEFGKQGRRMNSRRKKKARSVDYGDIKYVSRMEKYGDKRWPFLRRDRKSSDVTKELDKEFY